MKPFFAGAVVPPTFTPTSAADDILFALAASSRIPAQTITEAIRRKVRLAMSLLGVRSAFVSGLTNQAMHILVSEDDAGCGIPDDGVVALEETFCQYVRATDAPVIIADAASDGRVARVRTRQDFTIGAYLGVPIHMSDGSPYGTLCALDTEPHTFSATHVALMQILAQEIGELIERERTTQYILRDARSTNDSLSATIALLDQQHSVLQIIAHDLRTPLGALQMSVDFLRDDMYGSLAPPQREVADAMGRATQHMQRLVNDIADAASDEAQFALLNEDYDAVVVAEHVLAMCRARAETLGLTMHLETPAQALPMTGDRTRLMQALLNLVSNALTYTEAGRVQVQIAPDDVGVRFTVLDSGPGIAASDQERIWRAHERANDRHPGQGLGLHVVTLLVRHMGGRAGVQSAPGQGSAFWLWLPRTGPRPQRVLWAL